MERPQGKPERRYEVVSMHGEIRSVFHVMDRWSSDESQPAIVASYPTRDVHGQFLRNARSAADTEAAWLNRCNNGCQ